VQSVSEDKAERTAELCKANRSTESGKGVSSFALIPNSTSQINLICFSLMSFIYFDWLYVISPFPVLTSVCVINSLPLSPSQWTPKACRLHR